MTVAPKKKLQPWMKWTLGIVSGLALLAVLVGLSTFLWLMGMRDKWTVTAPEPLQEVKVEQSDRKHLESIYLRAKRTFEGKQRGEVTFTLTADELNKLIAVAEEGKQLRDKVRFAFDGEKIVASVNLNLNSVPKLKLAGRYLSGDFDFDMGVEDGKLHVELLSGKVKGVPMPKWMMRQFNEKITADKVMSRLPSYWKKQLKTLKVKDSKLTVTLQGN